VLVADVLHVLRSRPGPLGLHVTVGPGGAPRLEHRLGVLGLSR